MTIQEAIKSGKPFRRKLHTEYMIVHTDYILDLKYYEYLKNLTNQDCGYIMNLPVSFILADDWEIKE